MQQRKKIGGTFWEILGPNKYFFDAIGGHRRREGSENWAKLIEIMTFVQFSYISTSQKIAVTRK